jgi:hypothetical protein
MNASQLTKFVEGFNEHAATHNQINRFGYKRTGSECARRIILMRQMQGVVNACFSLSSITVADVPAMLALEKEADKFFEGE